jgi:hypothetical protein
MDVCQHRNWDIWLVDQTRNTGFPLTTDPAQETDAIWSPEGNRIAFCDRA